MANNNDWHTPAPGLTLPPGGGPGSAYVVIGSPSSGVLPASLIAYYAGLGQTIVAGIVSFDAAGNYTYEVWFYDLGLLSPTTAWGGNNAGVINEAYRIGTDNLGIANIILERDASMNSQMHLLNTSLMSFANNAACNFNDTSTILLANSAQMTLVNTSTISVQSGTLDLQAGGNLFVHGPFNIDSVSAARGLTAYTDSVAATAAIGAEAVVLTTPAMTFVDGRCYEVTWAGNVFGSVAAPGAFGFLRIRQTNLAGAIKAFTQVHLPAAGAQNYTISTIRIRRTTGAGNLNGNLVLTAQASAGTVTFSGAATDVRYLNVKDCGAETDYGNAITI